MTKNTPATIGIASGRPGAGGRTVGVNLAAALAAVGRRVGLTGTETLGPIVPETLGAETPRWRDGRLVPSERFGIQVMSFAYLVEDDERMEGRLPSLGELAARFESLVAWDGFDVLFIDLPSSKDAIQAIYERLKLDGVAIVAMPRGAQEGATAAAVAVFQAIGVPVLGLIENLSYHQCRQCGRRDAAEAAGAVPDVARPLGVRYLGEVPISIALRDSMDESCPAVACTPKPPEADMFERVALALMAVLEKGEEGKEETDG